MEGKHMTQPERLTHGEMIGKILETVKANGVPTTGDMFLALAFRTESELRGICRELHIGTTR
jgi:hypothetical protein